MRMRIIGLTSLVVAAVLVSSAVLAGRVDGKFATEDGVGNQACTVIEGTAFSVVGTVAGPVTNGCAVTIGYATPLPHKASSSALKGDKTKGSSKVSQSIDALVTVRFEDVTLASCTTPWVAESTAEKCKVSASLKSSTASSADSSRVSVSCELGNEGADLDTLAGTAQFSTLVTAFEGVENVKLDDKGKLTIKHDGVPDTSAPVQLPCGVATTTTTTIVGATTTTSTTTTTTLPPV